MSSHVIAKVADPLPPEMDADDLASVGKVIEHLGALYRDGAQPLPIFVYVKSITINKGRSKPKKIVVKHGGTMSTEKVKVGRDSLAPITTGKGHKVTSTTTVGQSPELDQRLDELRALVETLAARLPPAKAAAVRDDLDGLTAQAKSEKPTKKWYEVSADGLIEAANSVVGMAEPVTKAVNAVVKIIAGG
jgi:hypothetical protein